MSDNAKIIEKIRKLLALARSPNANEAASALEKAMALMAEHGVDKAALDMAALGSVTSDFTGSRAAKPPLWDTYLSRKICAAFGVRMVRDYGRFPRPRKTRFSTSGQSRSGARSIRSRRAPPGK
jgi:hypothetical protein